MSLSLSDMNQEHLYPMLAGHLHPSSPPKGRIYQWHKMEDRLFRAFREIQAMQVVVHIFAEKLKYLLPICALIVWFIENEPVSVMYRV